MNILDVGTYYGLFGLIVKMGKIYRYLWVVFLILWTLLSLGHDIYISHGYTSLYIPSFAHSKLYTFQVNLSLSKLYTFQSDFISNNLEILEQQISQISEILITLRITLPRFQEPNEQMEAMACNIGVWVFFLVKQHTGPS